MDDTCDIIKQKLKKYYKNDNRIEYWNLIIGITNIYGSSEKNDNGESFFDNDKYILLDDLEKILIKLLNEDGFELLMSILEEEEPLKIWYYDSNEGVAFIKSIK